MLGEIDGLDLTSGEVRSPPDRVESLLADLVESSKAAALEKLGDGERGLAIARDWPQPKLAVALVT
jgi:hypothetical protein